MKIIFIIILFIIIIYYYTKKKENLTIIYNNNSNNSNNNNRLPYKDKYMPNVTWSQGWVDRYNQPYNPRWFFLRNYFYPVS